MMMMMMTGVRNNKADMERERWQAWVTAALDTGRGGLFDKSRERGWDSATERGEEEHQDHEPQWRDLWCSGSEVAAWRASVGHGKGELPSLRWSFLM